MHLIAYQDPKDKGTICHGFILIQQNFRHKKPAAMSGPSYINERGLFAAHNFPKDESQD